MSAVVVVQSFTFLPYVPMLNADVTIPLDVSAY